MIESEYTEHGAPLKDDGQRKMMNSVSWCYMLCKTIMAATVKLKLKNVPHFEKVVMKISLGRNLTSLRWSSQLAWVIHPGCGIPFTSEEGKVYVNRVAFVLWTMAVPAVLVADFLLSSVASTGWRTQLDRDCCCSFMVSGCLVAILMRFGESLMPRVVFVRLSRAISLHCSCLIMLDDDVLPVESSRVIFLWGHFAWNVGISSEIGTDTTYDIHTHSDERCVCRN